MNTKLMHIIPKKKKSIRRGRSKKKKKMKINYHTRSKKKKRESSAGSRPPETIFSDLLLHSSARKTRRVRRLDPRELQKFSKRDQWRESVLPLLLLLQWTRKQRELGICLQASTPTTAILAPVLLPHQPRPLTSLLGRPPPSIPSTRLHSIPAPTCPSSLAITSSLNFNTIANFQFQS